MEHANFGHMINLQPLNDREIWRPKCRRRGENRLFTESP